MISIQYMIGCLIPLIIYRLFAMYYTNVLHYNLVESHLLITILLCNTFAYSMIYIMYDEDHPYETIKRIKNSSSKDILDLILCCFPVMILGNFLYLVSSPLEVSLFAGTSIFFNTISSIIFNKNKYLMNWKILLMLFINIICCSLPSIYKIYNNDNTISLKGILANLTLLIIGGIISARLEKVHSTSSILNFKDSKFSSVVFSLALIEMVYMIIFTPSVLLTGKYIGNEFPEWEQFVRIYALGCISGFIFAILFIAYDYCIFKLKSVEVGINENINLVIISSLAVALGFDNFNIILIISLVLTIITSIIITLLINYEETKYKLSKEKTKSKSVRIQVSRNNSQEQL